MEKINLIDVNRRIDTNEKVFLKVSAEWCGQCKMTKLIFDKIISKYPNIIFLEIDVDDNNLWDDKILNVKQVPTFIGYNKKKIVFDIVGYQAEEELLKLLDSL